jgi:(2Fe-2S) ferredoxin
VEAPRELCFEVVASAGRVIERISETERVVEFLADYRGRAVRTVERVVLEPPHRIRYSWLKGPLPSVEEEIAFLAKGSDETEIVYSGAFSFQTGVLGWVYGRLVVKSRFERIVREHLLDGKTIAEKRAARRRRYPSDRLEPDGRT